MRFISHHVMPLVITSLGSRNTHTHTHTHTNSHTNDLHRINFKKPGRCWPAAGAPGLTKNLIHVIKSYKWTNSRH